MDHVQDTVFIEEWILKCVLGRFGRLLDVLAIWWAHKTDRHAFHCIRESEHMQAPHPQSHSSFQVQTYGVDNVFIGHNPPKLFFAHLPPDYEKATEDRQIDTKSSCRLWEKTTSSRLDYQSGRSEGLNLDHQWQAN